MNTMQRDVREFHRRFKLGEKERPILASDKIALLRRRLIEEEKEELFKAMYELNLIKIADGLADLLYVVFGTAIVYGIDMEEVFDEVHRSNMSKVWKDGTVHYDEFGKMLKPSTYSPADIESVLRRQQHG